MLGVLGGMGPMATVDFMRKIVENTPADCDQDHVAMVVCSAVNIPDRTAAIRGEGPDPLPAMREALQRLERAGATCIAIPCNTAHHWHEALQRETVAPILHIVEAVSQALALRGIQSGNIGLMATEGTLRTGLYQRYLARLGFTCVAPGGQDQMEVMRAIRLVKAGRIAEAGAILKYVAEALMRKGCRQIVLACTEIPLVLADMLDDPTAILLDATEALARACVQRCRQEI